MVNEISVDLPKRLERRFLLPDSKDFVDISSEYMKRKKFSDNEYVQTIYFNNDEHIIPFENSVKVRKYMPNAQNNPILNDETYFLDIKEGLGNFKQKTRLEANLDEATKILNKKFNFPKNHLRPYVLVEYLRRHYIPKNFSDIRLTLDSGLRYFYLTENNKLIYLGGEDYTRLEIKEGKSDPKFKNLMEEMIKDLELIPVISKKFKAYNLLNLYHSKISGKKFHKELKDCEIESKLEAESENVFYDIKQTFRNGINFRLPNHFPYTFESASINRYYHSTNGSFKAMFLGNEVEIVRKNEGEIIKDKFGLECIIKRKETKGELVETNSNILTNNSLGGELYRMRKAFWIENEDTKRFYHVSLDCCLGLPGKLYQVEVEYTGKYGEPKEYEKSAEDEILEDIGKITKTLVDKFPSLKPSKTTKMGWLGIDFI
ncbi:MAG: hypothetical protein AABW45_00280 [Nanoarchaeota archaeon]